MRNSDLIINCLVKNGVRMAFGIPGGPLSSVYYAIEQAEKLQCIVTQHETSAVYLAMGYWFFSDRKSLPLVFATAGPGMSNLITGLASATEERCPLIVITANIPTHLQGRFATQDSFASGLNQVAMFDSLCAENHILTTTDNIESLIANLIETALKTQRPVHLNLPAQLAFASVAEEGRKSNVSQDLSL